MPAGRLCAERSVPQSIQRLIGPLESCPYLAADAVGGHLGRISPRLRAARLRRGGFASKSAGMSNVLVESFNEPAALLRGLKRLRETGMTPRGLLFLALTP